jgi:SAM-dependent methyltransferase
MCGEERLVPGLRLTPTPPGNALVSAAELETPETSYPLELHFCTACSHVQLGHVVNPSILYQRDYLYVSGTSSAFVQHLEQYAAEMIRRHYLEPGALVADIGSNDGTCLRGFQRGGMRVVGIDPATSIAERATAAGIETIPTFFSHDLALELRSRFGPARFITSHNALAHVDALDDVVRGVAHWLDHDGVFVLEVGYFADVYRNLFFDTIYHEHLDYHTVAPFSRLFERTGMELIAVERVSPQGGSLRVTAQKRGGRLSRQSSVDQLIALERSLGLNTPDALRRFGEQIDAVGTRFRALLAELKSHHKAIAGFGAPTKAVTLLTHFGVGRESLDFIVEDNPLKHGLFMPLSHIPVVPAPELYSRNTDYTVILAWNFAEPIMRTHQRYTETGRRFIVPLPEPRIC